MIRSRRLTTTALLAASACLVSLSNSLAQQGSVPPAGNAQAVSIKREVLSITDPASYNVPLRTLPVKSVEITAPADGYVRKVQVKSGAKVAAQAEAIRMDDARNKLLVERAKSHLQSAKIEAKIADAKGDDDAKELAKSRLESAQIDLKIAEYDLEQASIKLPFAGELFRVHVVDGQFVRAGEPLMTLADTSSLLADVPGDRSKLKEGAELELMVEQTPVKGKVQTLLPPDSRFEPLRNLVPGLASAVVQIDNSKGEFFAGQTVFLKLIPRQPFTQVPIASISNHPDGKRQVQVMRQGVIRDLPVIVLTQVGTERVYVAGAFGEGDELIVSSSQPLKDGQLVRLQAAAAAPSAGGETPAQPTTTTKPAAGL